MGWGRQSSNDIKAIERKFSGKGDKKRKPTQEAPKKREQVQEESSYDIGPDVEEIIYRNSIEARIEGLSDFELHELALNPVENEDLKQAAWDKYYSDLSDPD